VDVVSWAGASGVDKFKKTIEKDAALERRFQQVGWGW
jgi:ATP-dependent Clp protease ATP-binding subunit ClpA